MTATRTRIIPLKLKLAALVLLAAGGFVYQTTSNQANGPRDVTLVHTWHTERGVNNSRVHWTVVSRYSSDVVMEGGGGAGEAAAGGTWQRHVVLPGPGAWTVILAATPVRILMREGGYRGASSTCVIRHGQSRVADTGSSAPNDGCAATMVVVVGANE